MIEYRLTCDNGHRFDAWFKSAAAFDDQNARGIVSCPQCQSTAVSKAPMAPAIGRSGSEKVSLTAGHPDLARLRQAMMEFRRKVTRSAENVGDRFAEEARKIHFNEADPRSIYGEATRDEVAGLIEDGIDFMPLPNLPDDAN